MSRIAAARRILSAIMLLLPAAAVDSAENDTQITLLHRKNQLVIRADEKPIATYVYSDEQILRPYFTALKAPSGVQITRHHPPRKNIDATDHATMHPGLWLAFGDISGKDFWRNKARVRHTGFVERPRSKGPTARFAVRNEYVANGRVICEETCRIRILVRPAGYLIIWDSRFTSDNPAFYFGDQEEMGLGVRLATPIAVNSSSGGRILDNRGNRNEKEIWGKPSLWCDYAGPIEDVFAGVTIMPHPENFAPSRWHVRDYGFMTANPFGRKAFDLGTPARQVIEKGEQLRLGFGILLHITRDEEALDLHAAYADYLKTAQRHR